MDQGASSPVQVNVKREPEAEGLPLPDYATAGSAGLDLMAALPEDSPVTLAPGGRALISTGLRFALPPGYEGQIRPRSGLAARHGIGLVNSPGTLDGDFRGIVHVIMINWGENPYTIRRGDRIAQMVIAPVTRAALVEVQELESTERGEGGFGSTGFGNDRDREKDL